ncbi:PIG-L deacetylase family protein [Allomeiothermus silvanus]|uniref:PIG-L deacetylase family protein n=1 Tax=Allomeiothermus silvanus TaxID=52022 RepID=UPI0023F3410A|nr:PIG-L deacetylase family protein [Allomeiothermus silvanus]
MKRMLVFSAHAADFVWRAGGAIASVCAQGGQARVVALSYGERGESGELWKDPKQTIERVKAIRHAEATRAAQALGASFECLDLGDYPLRVNDKAVERLIEIIVETAPDLLLTHAEKDPFNPDHPVTYQAVEKARQLATGAGVASAFRTVRPPELLLFEPHQPELCGFVPTLFLDITPVWEKKQKAMEAFASQGYLRQYYSERAAHRANHARRIAGHKNIERAEAFQRVLPQVVRSL